MESLFADFKPKAFPYQYDVTVVVDAIAGGVPSDPHTAEAWIRTKVVADSDDLIRKAVAEVMADRGVSADEAVDEVARKAHLNGFRRDEHGLFIRDYQAAAMLKESVSICVAGGRLPSGRAFGVTKKGIFAYFPEHVGVEPRNLYLGVTEPTGIALRFPSTFRGTGIQNEEYVEDAKISFRVLTDHLFTDDEWAHIWVTAETTVGLGASRGQGFGRFAVVQWDRMDLGRKKGKS